MATDDRPNVFRKIAAPDAKRSTDLLDWEVELWQVIRQMRDGNRVCLIILDFDGDSCQVRRASRPVRVAEPEQMS